MSSYSYFCIACNLTMQGVKDRHGLIQPTEGEPQPCVCETCLHAIEDGKLKRCRGCGEWKPPSQGQRELRHDKCEECVAACEPAGRVS